MPQQDRIAADFPLVPLADREVFDPWLDRPEQVIGALEPLISPGRKAKIERALANRIDGVTVVLDNLHDPRNGAAILRTCDAFGLCSVHTLEDRNLFRVSRKVTLGAHHWLLLHRFRNVEDCVRHLESEGYRLAALDHQGRDDLAHLAALRQRERIALCFGNEHEGVSPALLERCASVVSIPMHGFVTCLNVSVSAAVALASLLAGATGDLDATRQARLRALWYLRSVRGSDQIVARRLAARNPSPGGSTPGP